MHPAQQQGRRIPPSSFDMAFLMRISLVSVFLADITQQIHSLRASGVISPQINFTVGEAFRAFCKSSGILCGILEVSFLFMR